MKKILIICLLTGMLFVPDTSFFISQATAQQQKQPLKPQAKPQQNKPNKAQIVARLKKEKPFVQAKVGQKTTFSLLSEAIVSGKIYKITEKGVWLDDGIAKLLQRRNSMSMEGRAKFYKEDYEKYINLLAEEEVRDQTGVAFKWNEANIAKPNDPRFKKPTKKSSAGIGGKTNLNMKK